MKTYARIDGGKVVEIINPEVFDAEDPTWINGQPSRIGQEKPIEVRFHPALVENMIDVSDMEPQPSYGWTLEGGDLIPPTPYQPSPEEVIIGNTTLRDLYLGQATLALTPLQYAVDFEVATDEEKERLVAWKKYMIALNRINLTVENVIWPEHP